MEANAPGACPGGIRGAESGESAEALARIAQLYEVEDRAKGLSPQARCELRQAQSLPRLLSIRAWLDQLLPDRWQAARAGTHPASSLSAR